MILSGMILRKDRFFRGSGARTSYWAIENWNRQSILSLEWWGHLKWIQYSYIKYYLCIYIYICIYTLVWGKFKGTPLFLRTPCFPVSFPLADPFINDRIFYSSLVKCIAEWHQILYDRLPTGAGLSVAWPEIVYHGLVEPENIINTNLVENNQTQTKKTLKKTCCFGPCAIIIILEPWEQLGDLSGNP